MSTAPHIEQSRSAWLLIALLLVSLLTAAGHQHEGDEPHPLTQCAICLQLQSAQFAVSNATPLVALSAEPLHDNPARAVTWFSPASVYQSRAPPRF